MNYKKSILHSMVKYLIIFVCFVVANPVYKELHAAVRLKDVAYVQGVRDNQLYGYGLVIGLQGTGDNSQTFKVTSQIGVNVLRKLGVLIEETDFFSKNTAVVMVTATIPAFVRPGDKLDVTISSIGNAKSLEGGVLLQTALQGADNEVYAVAQGPLTVGGYSIKGDAQYTRKNIVTTAHITNGAIIEKEIYTTLLHGNSINLVFRDFDFTTTSRAVHVINNLYPSSAKAIDAAVVEIVPPQEFQLEDKLVQFIANIEELYITVDSIAKVVINERTGTIVAGENVRISTVAVAHGNLSITISEKPEVSQPNMLASGSTREVPRTDIQIGEEESRLTVIPAGVTISEVARALNVLGVTPRDLISIFQAIKRAGALHAEIVVM